MHQMLVLAAALAVPPIQEPDIRVLRTVNGFHTPALDVAARVFSNEVLLVALPPATGYALARDWGTPLRVAGAEALGGALGLGLKFAFDRPRPYVTYPDLRLPLGPDHFGSFPSGHAAVSFAGATALALDQPAAAVPAYLWAGLVCYSRMYNGVHYPSDLLGGALVGVGSAYLVHALVPGPAAPRAVMPLQWSGTF
jgi:undecaprenyl-diphosphatase